MLTIGENAALKMKRFVGDSVSQTPIEKRQLVSLVSLLESLYVSLS